MKQDRPREGGPDDIGQDVEPILPSTTPDKRRQPRRTGLGRSVRSQSSAPQASPPEGRDPLRLADWCPAGGYHGPFFLYRCLRCDRPISVGGGA
jgi:hypothetical protein